MAAKKENTNARKKPDDIKVLVVDYIDHIASGYSKESFIDCDYRTIETYLESGIVLQSLKSEIEKAQRMGRKHWEQIGHDITTGKIRGNPATWIFTMKNKYPESWKDKSEVDHSGEISLINADEARYKLAKIIGAEVKPGPEGESGTADRPTNSNHT